MTTETITFAQMGFASTVTASSATPSTDGYVGEFNGLPYHIHPTATPGAFAALETAIAANEVTVNAYGAPTVTLAEAQAQSMAALTAACQASIVSGFASSALGSAHSYPSTPTDQANQQSVAASPSGGLLWCKSSAGTWGLVAHTQAQAQAVCASFVSWLNACQQQLATLLAQVNASDATVSGVQAIAWTAPTQ